MNITQRLRAATMWTVQVFELTGKRWAWRSFKKPFRRLKDAKAMAITAMEDVEVGASRVVQTYVKKGVEIEGR